MGRKRVAARGGGGKGSAMTVERLRGAIDAAEGRVPADTLFVNARIVDVYAHRVAPG